MRLRLTNAGPIVEAEADLSVPLTVLVGPNNTGKTWFSTAIYAAMKADLSGPTAMELARELVRASGRPIDLQGRWDELRSGLERDAAGRLPTCLTDCLALEGFAGEFTVRAGLPPINSEVFWVGSLTTPLANVWVSIQSGSLNVLFTERPPGIFSAGYLGGVVAAKSIHSGMIVGSVEASVPPQAIEQLARALALELLQGGAHRTWALPAERAAMVLFANELAAASIRGDGGFRYPWPIRDALATHFEVHSNKPGPFAPIADRLEARMLRGAIRRDERQRLLYTPAGSDQALTMHHTSSMVKSVASIVEHLRFRANVGDMLLIDEPELNLHPDNQRLLARALVEAANAGLRLVLSTHSDWFLRELNRLMIASSLPAEALDRHGLLPSEVIAPEKVQALFFREGRTTRLAFGENGLDMGTLDEETQRLQIDEQEMYLDRDGLRS